MSNVLFHEILLEAAEVVEVDDAAEEVEGDFTEEAEETTEAEKEDVAGTETEDTTITTQSMGSEVGISSDKGIELTYSADGVTVFNRDALKDGEVWADKSVEKTSATDSSFNETLSIYIEQWCAANKATAMAETDANGMTTVSGLKPGLYFVTETKTPQNIFSTTLPFFVPAPMTDVTGDRWMPHISLYPKNESDECELDKLVSEHGVFEDGTTASEGDVLDYRIVTKVSKITSGVTHFTKFDIRDRMGNGLTYNKDVTISIYDSKNDARNGTGTPAATWTPAMFNVTYENTSSGSSMTIVPTADGFKELNSKCSEKYLVASYSVTVNSNDNTVLGDSGNDNDVTLTYSRSNTAYSETLEDKARVTTYGIDLKKTFSDGKGDASKVQFILRNTTDNYFLTATGSNGVYYVTGQAKEESGATAFSPAANGTLQINGMEADTYEMTEIKTDSGYTLLAQPMTIQITATDTTIVPSTANVTGFGKTQAQVGVTLNHSASATVDSTDTRMLADDESNNARVEMAVNNTRNLLVDLPKTGGIGTVMFTVLGVCGTAAGAVVLAKSKRNDKKVA